MGVEQTLSELNRLLEPLAKTERTMPELPVILVMGSPRSGTTLMLQYLASLGLFSYPSNLIARFWENPYLGILVQKGISDLLTDQDKLQDFRSDLGRSEGLLAPSEFWYFWRTYFKFDDINLLSPGELDSVDGQEFLGKLSAFEQLQGKPPVMKGMIMNWHIEYLMKLYPKFLFIHVKRDLMDSAKSLYQAREKFFKDVSKWYSFKPPEYTELRKLPPVEQVTGQVHYTQTAIDRQLTKIPESNQVTIGYETFCNDPLAFLTEVREKLALLGFNLDLSEVERKNFEIKKKGLFPAELNDTFTQAVQKYQGKRD